MLDSPQELAASVVPLMTVDAFSALVGLDVGVLRAQVDKGYWPTIRVGKYRLINVEAVRLAARVRGQEFAL